MADREVVGGGEGVHLVSLVCKLKPFLTSAHGQSIRISKRIRVRIWTRIRSPIWSRNWIQHRFLIRIQNRIRIRIITSLPAKRGNNPAPAF
jgi:hypothetical protein